jgi:oligoribonuclease (3'-5' exoribonuclease)
MSEKNYNELDYIAALDLETSGLDEQNDQILEVAVVFGSVKDGKFTEKKRFERVLPLITDVEDWHERVLEMHTQNALLAAAIKAKRAAAYGDPELCFTNCDRDLLHAAPSLPHHKARWTLLGNTVHFDLRFVRRVFPQFATKLSHRVLDVSSTRLFVEGLGMITEPVEVPHRAMHDVLSSIAQFEKQSAWVREHFMHAGAVETLGASERRLGSTEVGHGAG